jgi:hypothetical protein
LLQLRAAPFLLHPRPFFFFGGSFPSLPLVTFPCIICILISFNQSHKMSAVQPVAVYALRVPPGVMVPAVPNAAASVSIKPHDAIQTFR